MTGDLPNLHIERPGVRSKELVYEDDIPGEKFVTGVTEVLGGDGIDEGEWGRLLIQFASGNVYRYTIADRSYERIVAREGDAQFLVDDLAPYGYVWSRTHRTLGHVYRFTPYDPSSTSGPLGFYLIDGDGDGEMDEIEPLTSLEDFQGHPLWDTPSYDQD